jgi:hypothetical protein
MKWTIKKWGALSVGEVREVLGLEFTLVTFVMLVVSSFFALGRHWWRSRTRRRLLCRFSGSILSDTLSSGFGDLRGLSTFGLYQNVPFAVFCHAFSSICLRHGEARRYISSLLGTLQHLGFSLHWNTSKVIESLSNETNPTSPRRLLREVWACTVAPSSDF